MKKYLPYLLVVLFAVSLVGCQGEESGGSFSEETIDGCSSNEECSAGEVTSEEVSYPVIPGLYECYLTDETLGLSSNENLPLAAKRIYPKSSRIEEYAKITELTINGITYPCEYERSGYYSTSIRQHEYWIDCDGVTARVSVRDDMSIMSWSRRDIYLCGLQPDVMTFEQAEKLALSFASKVIDVKKYERGATVNEVVPREGEPYATFWFTFSNSDPLYERDAMSIAFSAKGYVIDAYIGEIGIHDDLPDDLIDEEKLEKTMLYYLEKIYPLYYGKELNGQYEFIERDLLLTPEGEWVLRNRYALLNGKEKKGIELTVVLLDTNASGEESLDVS